MLGKMNLYDILPSIASGFFAALAGLLAKLTFGDYSDTYLARLATFLLVFGANALMMKYFVISLQKLGSGKATVCNFVANFMISAIFGVLIFGEVVSVQWFIGAGIMATGVYLILISD